LARNCKIKTLRKNQQLNYLRVVFIHLLLLLNRTLLITFFIKIIKSESRRGTSFMHSLKSEKQLEIIKTVCASPARIYVIHTFYGALCARDAFVRCIKLKYHATFNGARTIPRTQRNSPDIDRPDIMKCADFRLHRTFFHIFFSHLSTTGAPSLLSAIPISTNEHVDKKKQEKNVFLDTT